MWLTPEEWKPVADALDPTLTLITVLTPWVVRPERDGMRTAFYLRTMIAMALMYVLRAIEHSPYAIGPALGLEHYSTHTGFAVVLLTVLAFWRWWFALFGIAVLCGYGELMIYEHYHTLTDIAGTTLVICPLTVAICKFRLRLRPRLGRSPRDPGSSSMPDRQH